jgi:hypothetical protein
MNNEEIMVGDVFTIKSNGFILNPEIKVLEIEKELVKIIPTVLIKKTGGVLSSLNAYWISKEMLLKKRIAK